MKDEGARDERRREKRGKIRGKARGEQNRRRVVYLHNNRISTCKSISNHT